MMHPWVDHAERFGMWIEWWGAWAGVEQLLAVTAVLLLLLLVHSVYTVTLGR